MCQSSTKDSQLSLHLTPKLAHQIPSHFHQEVVQSLAEILLGVATSKRRERCDDPE